MKKTSYDLTNQCGHKKQRYLAMPERTSRLLPELMKLSACLIALTFSTTVARQDYFRLDDSLGPFGVKQFRLYKVKRSHKLPADYGSSIGSSEQAVHLLIRNRDRAELSSEQIDELNRIYRQISLGISRDSVDRNRIHGSEKHSAIEKEEMLFDLESKKLRVKEERGLAIDDLLLPHQKSILKQLQFDQAVQSYGVAWVLSRPPFSDELKTKKKQADAIMKIKNESEDKLVAAFLEFEENVQQIKKRSVGKMINELSRTQRNRLKEFNDSIAENISKLKL